MTPATPIHTIDDLSDDGVVRLAEGLGLPSRADVESLDAFRARVAVAFADDSCIDATPLTAPQPMVLGGFTLQGD